MRPTSIPTLIRFTCIVGLSLAITATVAAIGDESLRPRTYTFAPSDDIQFVLQERLIDAVPGDVIQLEAGRYTLQQQLDVVADNITIVGRGSDKTVLTFKRQTSGDQGIQASGNNFTLQGLAIEDTVGNAVKVLGARNVTFRDVRVIWTGEPSSSNGAYGLYPVECQNVLMENCTVIGASDAGLYVGQCRNVIVRSCRAERNVAGIEIENTINADVYDNVATDNSGGILVFDMPGLQVKAGRNARIFRNRVTDNNHANFADPGATVAAVPPGTGVMIMASDFVEVFDNEIEGSGTGGVIVVSYTALDKRVSDAAFDTIPEFISIHNNRFNNGGTQPRGQISQLLKPVLGDRFPDILWDGMVNPKTGKHTLRIADNGSATFANLNLAKLTPKNVTTGSHSIDRDLAAFVTPLEPLPKVDLQPPDPPASASSAAVRVYRSAPKKLSEYGLFKGPLAQQSPDAGVVLYDLNTPLFSDYSVKRRFIRLPQGQRIKYRDEGVLEFPIGTVIAKTFSYPNDMTDPAKGERLLETRIELRQDDGWYAFSYIWNSQQTEADLALGGRELEVSWVHDDGHRRRTRYSIPNANQCLNCHSQDKAFVPIGPTAQNLNRLFPGTEESTNQLSFLADAGMLEGLPAIDSIAKLPRFDDPRSASVERRARAWLDVNCAHCHNPSGTARTSGLDLRWEQHDPGRLGVWKSPVAAGHGSGSRMYDIVPGKPDESILMYRLESQDPSIMMPNVGRRLVFDTAVNLVREWIQNMPASE
jgi:parallel beta-helix repeat protein